MGGMTQPNPTEEAPPSEPAPSEPAPSETGQQHPDALAQIRIAGVHTSGTSGLTAALNELPNIPAVDGLRANTANGYYASVPPDELVSVLEGLPIPEDNAEAVAARASLVARAKAGEFSRR